MQFVAPTLTSLLFCLPVVLATHVGVRAFLFADEHSWPLLTAAVLVVASVSLWAVVVARLRVGLCGVRLAIAAPIPMVLAALLVDPETLALVESLRFAELCSVLAGLVGASSFFVAGLKFWMDASKRRRYVTIGVVAAVLQVAFSACA